VLPTYRGCLIGNLRSTKGLELNVASERAAILSLVKKYFSLSTEQADTLMEIAELKCQQAMD